MKKLLGVMIAAVLAFSGVIGVNAEGEEPLYFGQITEIFESEENTQYLNNTVVNQAAYDKIENGLRGMEICIDIAEFELNLDELKTLFKQVVSNNGELFWVQISYGYQSFSDGKIANLYPYYIDFGTDIDEMKIKFESEVDNILSYISEEMSDLEKVLFIHEYFATHYEYGDTSDTQAYNAYNYLVNKNAVCQGITLAFDYVAERAGVECNFAFSDEMRHVWNVVNLAGKWYYIDLTWNDNSHTLGYVSREDFLVSEEKFSQTHYAWYQNYETGNEYDLAFWREIDSNMVYITGFWWFIDNGYLCRYSFAENVIEEIKNITENVTSLAYLNGKIYYNNVAENSVYEYDLNVGESIKIPIHLDKNGTVWGLAEQYGELILTIKSSFYAVRIVLK
ncbi:MAG: hypothetical protein LBM93_06600 [Oscillospiraceae bacterium]|jgi:hypothetical protein|nr:hypothetical protein [Oscillospiraceae bacterium]